MLSKRTHDHIAIAGCSLEELTAYIKNIGEKPYRAKQILEWVYTKSIATWDDLRTLPEPLRKRLSSDFMLCSLAVVRHVVSACGDSVKYLLRTQDAQMIESVLIRQKDRLTLCVSTQIGCKFGCVFCASGAGGFVRNLSAAEIVDQYLVIRRETGKQITNIVFMGMGEPLDNYDATVQAIRIFTLEWGMAMGMRRITVSTAGVVPAIERFAREGFPGVKLSISLHAPTQHERVKLMPIAQRYPLSDLVRTLERVRELLKRDLTLEYIVIKKVNDTPAAVRHLAEIARRLQAKVNLIGYNPVSHGSWQAPSPQEIEAFRDRLEEQGVRTTVRYSAGGDIAAACGQLRLQNSL